MDTSTKITPTVMAIRELLMKYFRGTCVQRMTLNPNVSLRAGSYPTQYQYQRMDGQRRAPARLMIESVPIASMMREPGEITLKEHVLKRSPQFRQLHVELSEFLEKYLPEVRVNLDTERGV